MGYIKTRLKTKLPKSEIRNPKSKSPFYFYFKMKKMK